MLVSSAINAQVGAFDTTFSQGVFSQIGTSSAYLRVISTGNETCILTRNQGNYPPFPNPQNTSGELASLTNTPGSGLSSTSIGVYTGTGQFSQVTDVYKAPNGKIYAVGFEKDNQISPANPKFFINRYSAEGTIDPTFNGGATYFIDDPNYYYGEKVRPLADGKMLVAGLMGNGYLFLRRFMENGTPDSTFGTNGAINYLSMIDGMLQSISDMIILSSGKILISGEARDNTNNAGEPVGYVARLNANGSLDNTFGPNSTGYTTVNYGDVGKYSGVSSIILTSSERYLHQDSEQ